MQKASRKLNVPLWTVESCKYLEDSPWRSRDRRATERTPLRAMLDASIEAGGEASDVDIDNALEAKAGQLSKEGF